MIEKKVMDHAQNPARPDWRLHLNPQEADDLRSLRAIANFHGDQKKAASAKIEALRCRAINRRIRANKA